MENVVGAVVIGIGFLMAGLSALWLVWAAILWAVEMLDGRTGGIERAIGGLVLIALFPLSLLAIPLLLHRRRAADHELQTGFPV